VVRYIIIIIIYTLHYCSIIIRNLRHFSRRCRYIPNKLHKHTHHTRAAHTLHVYKQIKIYIISYKHIKNTHTHIYYILLFSHKYVGIYIVCVCVVLWYTLWVHHHHRRRLSHSLRHAHTLSHTPLLQVICPMSFFYFLLSFLSDRSRHTDGRVLYLYVYIYIPLGS